MEVKISARHGHLSADTQAKIAEKVEKLRRLFDRVSAIEVTANLEHRELPSIEVRLSVERTDDFVATGEAATIMAALDEVVHKIEQQLRKHKDKRRGHRTQKTGRVESPSFEETENEEA